MLGHISDEADGQFVPPFSFIFIVFNGILRLRGYCRHFWNPSDES